MTIQEKAIEQLERISEHLSAIGEKEDYTDVAIKALETTCIEDYPTCTECEHYDSEKHYCPRFCQVIKDTLAEAQPTDAVSREGVIETINTMRERCDTNDINDYHDLLVECFKVLPSAREEDAVNREKVIEEIEFYQNNPQHFTYESLIDDIKNLPPVTPQYTDEEIDKAQAVEQAYVDKMVELAVEESRKKWLNSFDTSSATKCFEAVNLLKQRLEEEE